MSGVGLFMMASQFGFSAIGLGTQLFGIVSNMTDIIGSIFGAAASGMDLLTLDLFDFDQSGGGLPGAGIGEDLGLNSPGTPGAPGQELSLDDNGFVSGKFKPGLIFYLVNKKTGKKVAYRIERVKQGGGRRRRGSQDSSQNARLAQLERLIGGRLR